MRTALLEFLKEHNEILLNEELTRELFAHLIYMEERKFYPYLRLRR